MAAEIGTGRQSYNYYDATIDGKVLKVNKGNTSLDGNTEFWFSGNRLQFKKDPADEYSETRMETLLVQMQYYKDQIIGKFTGKWTLGSSPQYPFTSRKEYELKLFNPTKTYLGDFTYYVNFCLSENDTIKNAEQFTYSSNYVLMSDNGTITGQVYKEHRDRALPISYFPHHDPDYPILDCEKWDKYFGNLPWTGENCPMMYLIQGGVNGNILDREDLKTWYGYKYIPKRDISAFRRVTGNDVFNETGDTTLYGSGPTSTTVNLGNAILPWLGGMIYNYGISMATLPNPTKESNSILDQKQVLINQQSPLSIYQTKYFTGLFNGGYGGGSIYSDLEPNTKYYIRIWEDVWGNIDLGEDPNQRYIKYSTQFVFRTSSIITDPEIAIWSTAFGITNNSASFHPGIIQKGDGDIEFGVCYKEGTQTPTINDMTVIITGEELNNIVTMPNCLSGKLYTFLPYAIRNKGQISQEVFYCDPLKIGNVTLQGSATINTFTTLSGPKFLPKVTLDYANANGSSSIDIKYTLIDNGGDSIQENNIGVCWSTNHTPTISDNIIQDLMYRLEYESKYTRVNNLLNDTTYYFRSYATNSVGTAYSDRIIAVKTGKYLSPNEIFIVYGTIAGTVTKNSAKIMFDVSFLNSTETSEIGICYSKNQNPTTLDNKVTVNTSVGSKIVSLNGLLDNVTYYYRPYYIDETGINYNGQMFFTTLKNVVKPVISNITSFIETTNIILSTNISSDGGSNTTNYIAYSKVKNDLTTTKPNSASVVGNGVGEFTLNVAKNSLSAGTWYYCSYSINEVGSSQSEIKSFITEDNITESLPTLITIVNDIKSNSAYWNTRIESLGNSNLVSSSILIKRNSDNYTVYSNELPNTPSDYAIINNLTSNTEYSLIFTVRTQYIIDNNLSDVVSTKVFTTLTTSIDPIESINPNIKLVLTQKTGSEVKLTISIENVINDSVVTLLGKLGSIPNINNNVDLQLDLNNSSNQSKTITMPKPGIWNFIVNLFNPNTTTQYYSSNVLKIDITPDNTIDNVGFPLYPINGEIKIIKGKRFVYNSKDNGWQRDYLYTENNQSTPTNIVQSRASSIDNTKINELDKQIKNIIEKLDQLNIAAPSIEKNLKPIQTVEQLDNLINPGFYYATINEIYEPFGITDFGTFTLYVSEGVDIDYATQIAVFATDLVPRIYFRTLSAGSVGNNYMKGWISLSDKSVLFNNENGTITNESIVYCVGAVTLTLPPATIKNRRIIIKSKNEDSADGIISVIPSLETEFIDYLSSIELEPLGYIELISNGEHWNVISKSSTSGAGVNFGDRVIVLTGNGNNAQKTTELLTSYATAKTMSPTSSSPVTILLPPGDWGMYSTFVLDTEYINISSITGRNDVWSNAADWQITADNISINGISWKGSRLRIHGSYPNVLIENCGGYIAGPSDGDPVNISSTFRNINSIGYQAFYNDGIIELSGVFENIKCGNGSFSLGMVGAGSKLSGKFINCTSADNGIFIADELSGTFKNCAGGYNAFLGDINGKMYDCVATQGFSTISSGIVRRCTLEGDGFTFPTPSAGGKVQLCIDSTTV